MDHEITYEEMLESTKTFKQKLGFFKIQQEFTSQCPVEHYEAISKLLKDLQGNIDEFLLALTEKQLNTVVMRNTDLQNRHKGGNNTDSGISSIVSTSSISLSEADVFCPRLSSATGNSQTIPIQETETPDIISSNKAKEHDETCHNETSHPLKKDSLTQEPIVAQPADESSSEEENKGEGTMRENSQNVVKDQRNKLVIDKKDSDNTAENLEDQEDDKNFNGDSYA